MPDKMRGPGGPAKPTIVEVDKWQRVMNQSSSRSLSWSMCPSELLKDAVANVTGDGAALLLSQTSDGGACMVQVLVGVGQKPKFYAASLSELEDLLRRLAEV